jgi:hypothetical protein
LRFLNGLLDFSRRHQENNQHTLSMRTICLTWSLLLALTLSAKAQLLLNPGDVYTYQFNSLPEVVSVPPDERSLGGFYFHVSSYDPVTDFLMVEMFENSTNEPPLVSFVTEFTSDGYGAEGLWADFQGTVRFTMLSGSVTLDSITTLFQVPFTAESSQRHQLTFIPARGAGLLERLVPCSGPASGGTWKNHGAYVSTLGKTARDLVAQGLLTLDEADAALKAASASTCGK